MQEEEPVYLLLSQDLTKDLDCTLSITVKGSSVLYSDDVHFGSCPIIIRLFIQKEQLAENLSMKLFNCQNEGSYTISACTNAKRNNSGSLNSYWQMQYSDENIYSCKISLNDSFSSTSVTQLHRTVYSFDDSRYYLVVTLPIIYTAILAGSLIILILQRIRSLASFKKTSKIQYVEEYEDGASARKKDTISDSYSKRNGRDFHHLRMHTLEAEKVFTSKAVEVVATSNNAILLDDHLLINCEIWQRAPESFISEASPDSENSIYSNIKVDVDFLHVESSEDVNTAEAAESIMLASLKEAALRLLDTESSNDEATGIAMDKYSVDEHPFLFEDDIAEIDDHLRNRVFTETASSQYRISTHAVSVNSNAINNFPCDPVVPMLDVKLTAGTKKMTVDMKERAKVFEPALRRSFDGNYPHS